MADGTFNKLQRKWFSPILGEEISVKDVVKFVVVILIHIINIFLIIFVFSLKFQVKMKIEVLLFEIEERKLSRNWKNNQLKKAIK